MNPLSGIRVRASVPINRRKVAEKSLMYKKPKEHEHYLVPTVVKALAIVQLLREAPQGLRLEDICRITGTAKSTTYRILRTLMAANCLFRSETGAYRTMEDQDAPEVEL